MDSPELRRRRGARPFLAPVLMVVLSLLPVTAGVVAADVVSASATSMVIEESVDIDADPEEVWEQLVRVGKWWSGAHSFSGDAANLRLEAAPGGCFCETLPDGGGVVHLTVAYSNPGVLLRLRGGLGPLQEFAVTGVMDWSLEAIEGGTRLTVKYRVFGTVPDGLEGWAQPVDGVLSEQLHRLESLIETGSPELGAGLDGRP